jgi:hypothetical protein
MLHRIPERAGETLKINENSRQARNTLTGSN